MRKSLLLISLILTFALFGVRAETFSLTDGGSVTGDILKFDDNGLMVRADGDVYTNIAWARISQTTLKQLVSNPKIRLLVEPFIEPDAALRPAKPDIQINSVVRMERPANPSIFGGLFTSPLGWFLLLLIYGANLFAAYEIAIVKARAKGQVMGVAAILPVIGPAIFLAMKMNTEPPPEVKVVEAIAAEVEAAQKPAEQVQIAEASWKQAEEKKIEPQIFARGKFTFNKRFLETKFADFTGAASGAQAKAFTMTIRTTKEELIVERVAQIGPTEAIFETVQRGQVTVPLNDLQEIKLTPKTK